MGGRSEDRFRKIIRYACLQPRIYLQQSPSRKLRKWKTCLEFVVITSVFFIKILRFLSGWDCFFFVSFVKVFLRIFISFVKSIGTTDFMLSLFMVSYLLIVNWRWFTPLDQLSFGYLVVCCSFSLYITIIFLVFYRRKCIRFTRSSVPDVNFIVDIGPDALESLVRNDNRR